jgi:D-glycero-alpha-D-manno-heptose 1-phosphate guanylyltransferase
MAARPIAGVGAVILAGGFGSRVRHLLPDLPKPMAPVLNQPFLDWVLAFLRRQGIRNVVLSTGHLAEVIERHYAGKSPGEVQCVREELPLGTAGGFLHACRTAQFASPMRAWLVLNGDSLTVTSLDPLLALLEDSSVDGGLLAVELSDASRFGTLRLDGHGLLRQFQEKQPGPGLVNAGVYLLKAPLVERAPAERPLSFETQWFPSLLAMGVRLRVVPCQAGFLDIGTPETLRQATDFIVENKEWFC